MKKPIWISVLILLVIMSTALLTKRTNSPEKIKGVSFTGASYLMSASEIDSVKSIGSNWICWMPYSYKVKGNLTDTFPGQWWGESLTGIQSSVSWSKSRGIKSFIKPHIWFTDGTFNGDFVCNSEEEWQRIELKYADYIIKFANLAEKENAELFSIGVELKNWVKERPAFWLKLIKKVREIYSGKLTYAANWDNYQKITFWDQLDYIAIDAYFPYSLSQSPTVNELKLAMEKQAEILALFSSKHNKQIIFSEYGFRSEDYCCEKPWEYKKGKPINYVCQKNAFEAFFKVFPKQNWYTGGFIWKWFASQHITEEGKTGYQIKNKPSQNLIQQHFKQKI